MPITENLTKEDEFVKACIENMNTCVFAYPSKDYIFKDVKNEIDTTREIIGEERLKTMLMTFYAYGIRTAYGKLNRDAFNLNLTDNAADLSAEIRKIKALYNALMHRHFSLSIREKRNEALIIASFNEGQQLFFALGDYIRNIENQVEELARNIEDLREGSGKRECM